MFVLGEGGREGFKRNDTFSFFANIGNYGQPQRSTCNWEETNQTICNLGLVDLFLVSVDHLSSISLVSGLTVWLFQGMKQRQTFSFLLQTTYWFCLPVWSHRRNTPVINHGGSTIGPFTRWIGLLRCWGYLNHLFQSVSYQEEWPGTLAILGNSHKKMVKSWMSKTHTERKYGLCVHCFNLFSLITAPQRN